jgi:hypothetical protein
MVSLQGRCLNRSKVADPMSVPVDQLSDGPVGSGIIVSSPSPNVEFKAYLADRPAPNGRWGAEMSIDITILLDHPVCEVWPVFKDFNRWQSRFGYEYDGVIGDKEDQFVYLGNRAGANDLKWQEGLRFQYIVRKVVPGRLIYMDSAPAPIEDTSKHGVWEGHNVFMLFDEDQTTKVVIFIEHTWYSATMTLEELRAEAKGTMDGGLVFWRDYFIPDLISTVASG